ncbi:MAG: hypothetical protein VX111_07890, partial [Planctomycetota bacterium]|nr:hypothetical protein [Planctomycetota bacterium]
MIPRAKGDLNKGFTTILVLAQQLHYGSLIHGSGFPDRGSFFKNIVDGLVIEAISGNAALGRGRRHVLQMHHWLPFSMTQPPPWV